jgi:hypothetical protein
VRDLLAFADENTTGGGWLKSAAKDAPAEIDDFEKSIARHRRTLWQLDRAIERQQQRYKEAEEQRKQADVSELRNRKLGEDETKLGDAVKKATKSYFRSRFKPSLLKSFGVFKIRRRFNEPTPHAMTLTEQLKDMVDKGAVLCHRDGDTVSSLGLIRVDEPEKRLFFMQRWLNSNKGTKREMGLSKAVPPLEFCPFCNSQNCALLIRQLWGFYYRPTGG